ncbi:hypothetical protein M6D93_05030 [Jatrophihabitans telluris]|uniref:GP-PDE domain-containing protein n=1 Tax=Jatrophihabitans telluris TaxID=2038343 RepID=A0ABY4R0T0_9ACTN|nr:glycerophosphodiester phosphodiesterase family protein [Jatrophihabitans telluris]UQX89369.1 hypothetical protein M6D93_05030 [Jatrophihabitans telluris]
MPTPVEPNRRAISRRTLLAGGAAAIGGGLLAGAIWEGEHTSPPLPSLGARVRHWQSTRGERYFIAHRGSGDVLPEHSYPAYDAAIAWGAPAMEISTSSTSDGVLVCMHDLTYDRTTNWTGQIHDQPSSVLSRIGIRQPQLGARWLAEPLPAVPLFSEVLKRYGNKAILLVEAKRDADYPAMMAMVKAHGLQDSVMVKAFHTSGVIAKAKKAGYGIFSYLADSDVSAALIGKVARGLDPDRDVLVIPTTSQQQSGPLSADLVRTAVATKVPVWVYPVHRRSEAAYFFDLGVHGVVTSSYHYVSTQGALASQVGWAGRAIESGELTRGPAVPKWAPDWASDGTLTLAVPDNQHFLCLGQLAPLAQSSGGYRVDLQARWNVLPDVLSQHLALVFGHSDDRYYEYQLGDTDGYSAIIQANGLLGLFSHEGGNPAPTQLATPVWTSAVQAGEWMSFRLEVRPDQITWTRSDGATHTVSAADSRFRGGYLHIGREDYQPNSSASFRNLRISPLS